jgi:hypothetical protein
LVLAFLGDSEAAPDSDDRLAIFFVHAVFRAAHGFAFLVFGSRRRTTAGLTLVIASK